MDGCLCGFRSLMDRKSTTGSLPGGWWGGDRGYPPHMQVVRERVAVIGVAKVLIDSRQGHKLFWNSSSLLAKLAGKSFAAVNKNFYRVGQG